MSKIRYSSCASHVDAINDANDVNFHVIDIEEGNFSNSEETTSDSDNDDNAGLLSNSNDDTSEHEDSLAEEENDLLAVHTRRTETNKGEWAVKFVLAREAVVYFVQDSIAYAVDRQKRNADQYGRKRSSI